MTVREELAAMIQNMNESELQDIAFGILAIKAGATAEEAYRMLQDQKRRMQEDCAMEVKRK